MNKAEVNIKERNHRIAKEMKDYLERLRKDHQTEEDKANVERQKQFDQLVRSEKRYNAMKETQKEFVNQKSINSATKSVSVLPKQKNSVQKNMINLYNQSEVKSLGLGRSHKLLPINHSKSLKTEEKSLKTEEKSLLRASRSNRIQDKPTFVTNRSPEKFIKKQTASVSKHKIYYDDIVKKNFAPCPSFRKKVELLLIHEKLNENRRKRKIITKTKLDHLNQFK